MNGSVSRSETHRHIPSGRLAIGPIPCLGKGFEPAKTSVGTTVYHET